MDTRSLVALLFLACLGLSSGAFADEGALPAEEWLLIREALELPDGRSAYLNMSYLDVPDKVVLISAVGIHDVTWIDASGKPTSQKDKRKAVRLTLSELRSDPVLQKSVRWERSEIRQPTLSARSHEVSLVTLHDPSAVRKPVAPGASGSPVEIALSPSALASASDDGQLWFRVRTYFRRTVGATDQKRLLEHAGASLGGCDVRFAQPLLSANVARSGPPFLMVVGPPLEEQQAMGPDLFAASPAVWFPRPGSWRMGPSVGGYRSLLQPIIVPAFRVVTVRERKSAEVAAIALSSTRYASVHVPTYKRAAALKGKKREKYLASVVADAIADTKSQAPYGPRSLYASKLGIGIGWHLGIDPDLAGMVPKQNEVGALLKQVDDAMKRWQSSASIRMYDHARLDEISQVMDSGKIPPTFKPTAVEYWVESYFDATGKPAPRAFSSALLDRR